MAAPFQSCPDTSIFPDLLGFSNDTWASYSKGWTFSISYIDFNSYEPYAVAGGKVNWPSSSMLSSNDWYVDHCEGLNCELSVAYNNLDKGVVRLYDLDDYSAMKTYLLSSGNNIELLGVKVLQESK